MSYAERREAILEVLCIRRYDTYRNLAFEFHVSREIIWQDIAVLICSCPIETVRGRYGGGVKIADGFYLYRRKLTARHPDDKHKLIINEETAPVVRRMFEMCAAGIGARSIATTLKNEGILSPKEYTRFRKHNPECDGEFERCHFWTQTYVQFMPRNEIYVGSMAQGCFTAKPAEHP